jgi:hypothetical protein
LGGSGSAGEGKDIASVIATREQLLIQQQMGMKRSEKPPKLPPRDNMYPQVLKVIRR